METAGVLTVKLEAKLGGGKGEGGDRGDLLRLQHTLSMTAVLDVDTQVAMGGEVLVCLVVAGREARLEAAQLLEKTGRQRSTTNSRTLPATTINLNAANNRMCNKLATNM